MLNLNLAPNEYGEILDYTDDERKAIDFYINQFYKDINSLLSSDSLDYERTWKTIEDMHRFSGDMGTSWGVERLLSELPKIYSAFLKSTAKLESKRPDVISRGATQVEAESLRSGETIGRILSGTKGDAWRAFAEEARGSNNVPTQINLYTGDIPFIDVSEFLGRNNKHENEVILAPFSRVKEVSKREESRTYNGRSNEKQMLGYDLHLESQELVGLLPEDRKKFREEIISKSSEIGSLLDSITRNTEDRETVEFQIQNIQRQLERALQDYTNQIAKPRRAKGKDNYRS